MSGVFITVEKLFNSFAELSELLNVKDSAGTRRALKGSAIADFVYDLTCEAVIDTKYVVRKQHPLYTRTGTKVMIDVCILDGDDPLWDIEVKDYIDSKMYSSFTSESIKLAAAYRNIRFMGIGMQKAMSKKIQTNALIDLGIEHMHYLFTLLNTNRSPRRSLYLLDYTQTEINHHANTLLESMKGALHAEIKKN